jgi:NAD+ synthase (glutamine-hydrolysing)
LYANYQGCDGERVYYDGTPLIVSNDVLLAQGSQFSLCDVEVITATVNLDEVSSYRASIISRSSQAALQEPYPCIYVDIYLCDYEPSMNFKLTKPIKSLIREPEQEISFGISCWLWDYLRRSGSIGFFLPLSGGIDSGCVSLIVYNLCELLSEYVSKKGIIFHGTLIH